MKRVLCNITTALFYGGGLTAVALNYYRALWSSKYDSDFTIDFMSQNEISDEMRAELDSHGSKYWELPKRKQHPVAHYKAMRKILLDGNYDVYHLNCNSATAALDLLMAKPYVKNRIIHVHNSSTEYPIVHKTLRPILPHLYTSAIAVSKTSGDWLYDDNPYVVLNNAINVDKFSYSPEVRKKMRAEYGLNDEYVIGHIGKMDTDQKNQEYLIDMMPDIVQRVPNATLMLVGGGKHIDELKNQANALSCKDHVLFAGFQTNIQDYVQLFDLFVFPSRYEGLGMSALEAQASGLPAVISDQVPREAEVTGNCTFLGIGENDKQQWIEEIVHRSENRINRVETKAQVKQEIASHGYDIDGQLEKLIELYEK